MSQWYWAASRRRSGSMMPGPSPGMWYSGCSSSSLSVRTSPERRLMAGTFLAQNEVWSEPR